jgi:hypothetical protein
MSTFGAITGIVAGLALQVILYVVLGIDDENVSVIVIIILWAVFLTLAVVVVEKIRL